MQITTPEYAYVQLPTKKYLLTVESGTRAARLALCSPIKWDASMQGYIIPEKALKRFVGLHWAGWDGVPLTRSLVAPK